MNREETLDPLAHPDRGNGEKEYLFSTKCTCSWILPEVHAVQEGRISTRKVYSSQRVLQRIGKEI